LNAAHVCTDPGLAEGDEDAPVAVLIGLGMRPGLGLVDAELVIEIRRDLGRHP
jgi:hypothetical protein